MPGRAPAARCRVWKVGLWVHVNVGKRQPEHVAGLLPIEDELVDRFTRIHLLECVAIKMRIGLGKQEGVKDLTGDPALFECSHEPHSGVVNALGNRVT